MAQEPTAPALGYADFAAWYDTYRPAVLEPALDVAMSMLDADLAELLSDRELARIRNVSGRVKSKHRTWRKLRRRQYLAQVESVGDIPTVIDDLVGIRITCTNLRDLEMVQVALDSLPQHPGDGHRLIIDPSSERNYVDAPKESGYRGWHVNLGVLLDGAPVTCELQIRTLLQDSWGELTHEDSYSKAGELPPLVEVLSKRMADLLATLDDIAEDLRTELDRIDEAVVAEAPVDASADAGADSPVTGIAADAAELLFDRWRSLDRPIELASLAWALQKEFGAEVSDDWFGHRSFKRFLRDAVPDGEISTGRQAYLLPPAGETPPGPTAAGARDSAVVPDEAAELRRIDRGFPLLDTGQWQQLYTQLAAAWRRLGPAKPGTRMVNQLTRSARDRAGSVGEPLSRRHLDYVAKAVLAATDSGEPIDRDALADVFVAATVQRMVDLRILRADDRDRRDAVVSWLAG